MTSGHIVPIYNVIDFVNCRQPYRSLLTDSRSYAGILLDSDHRQLVAELDLMRIFDVWGRIEKLRMSKHVRYNTELLATKCFREQFQDVVSVSLSPRNASTTASETWKSVEHVLKSATESTIGRTASAATRDFPYCADISAMSA